MAQVPGWLGSWTCLASPCRLTGPGVARRQRAEPSRQRHRAWAAQPGRQCVTAGQRHAAAAARRGPGPAGRGGTWPGAAGRCSTWPAGQCHAGCAPAAERRRRAAPGQRSSAAARRWCRPAIRGQPRGAQPRPCKQACACACSLAVQHAAAIAPQVRPGAPPLYLAWAPLSASSIMQLGPGSRPQLPSSGRHSCMQGERHDLLPPAPQLEAAPQAWQVLS